MKKLLFFLFIIQLLVSCNKNKELGSPLEFFDTKIELKGELIELDKEFLGLPCYNLALYDSIILIADFNSVDGKFLFVVDIKNHKLLKKIINVGWGPSEHSLITNITVDKPNGRILFHEPNKKKMYSMLMQDILHSDSLANFTKEEFDLVDSFNEPTSYYKIIYDDNSKRYIGYGNYSDSCMYSLINATGAVINSGCMYPTFPNSDSYDQRFIRNLFYGNITSSGNRACCVAQPGFFEIVEINGDSISTICRKMFLLPEFTAMNMNNHQVPKVKRERLLGFVNVVSNTKEIYTTFSTNTMQEVIQSGSSLSKDLLVFDWDGNPVKHYILDHGIIGFVLDGKTIYAITNAPEPKLVKYVLD